MTTEKEKLAASLKSHLKFLEAMGISEVTKCIGTGSVARFPSALGSPMEARGLRAVNTANQPALGPPLRTTRSNDDKFPDESLDDIRTDIGDCTRCKLCKGRKNIVFGVGNPLAEIMFVGEGPGADEDAQGEPFVGRAGQLLTRIIEAMGMKRGDVYISNIVMCRPPSNRVPEPDEVASCKPFLMRRIAVINPKIIICLGATAVKNLLNRDVQITRIRGTWIEWHCRMVMPTFHPAFLLRNPAAKKEVWEDMKAVLKFLGKTIPQRK